MANLILAEPMTPAAISVSRGSPASNLLTDDPKEVWLDGTPNSTYVNVDMDFGSTQSIDTVALIAANPAAACTWRVQYGTSSYTTSTLVSASTASLSDGSVPYNLHYHRTAGAVSARYVRISVSQPTGAAPFYAGAAIVSKALKTTYNREWGAGRKISDTGTATRLVSGGFGTSEGARAAALNWTWGDLTEGELRQLFEMTKRRGETKPILVIEDMDAATYFSRGVFYGKFDRFESYDRRGVDRSRWSLKVDEWV